MQSSCDQLCNGSLKTKSWNVRRRFPLMTFKFFREKNIMIYCINVKFCLVINFALLLGGNFVSYIYLFLDQLLVIKFFQSVNQITSVYFWTDYFKLVINIIILTIYKDPLKTQYRDRINRPPKSTLIAIFFFIFCLFFPLMQEKK